MPLDGAFTVRQTVDEVLISVPLKGSSTKTVDVCSTENYIKVNYPPYITHIDLFGNVAPTKGIATIKDGTLELAYPKVLPGVWSSALFEASPSLARKERQQILRNRRNAALEAQRIAEQQQSKSVSQRNAQTEKLATKKQMELDDRERNKLDDLKEADKQQAEHDVYETLASLNYTARDGKKETVKKAKKVSFQEPNCEDSRTRVEVDVDESTPLQTKKMLNEPLEPEDIVTQTKGVELCVESPNGKQDLPHDSSNDIVRVTSQNEVQDMQQNNESVSSSPNQEIATNLASDEESVNTDVQTNNDVEQVVVKAAEETIAVNDSDIFDESDLAATMVETPNEDEELPEYIPEPRETTKVKIEFTPRVFPTPMRESKAHEEEIWMMKNRRHLDPKMRKKLENSRDISERDPYWLKAKGDDMFRANDFSSAVGAYSCALEIEPENTSCLANRAACFLKLEAFKRCVEDCTLALKATMAQDLASKSNSTGETRIIQDSNVSQVQLPTVAEFVASICANDVRVIKRRVRDFTRKVLVRRGTAYCGLGDVDEALADYQAAQECDPADKLLAADCTRLTLLVQARVAKERGDVALKSGKCDEALASYSRAIELAPSYVPALANRAACYITSGSVEKAVSDCSTALSLLNYDNQGTNGGHQLPIPGFQPSGNSEQCKEWKMRLLAKRGSCYNKLNRLKESLQDYDDALILSPDDTTIARNIAKLQLRLSTTSEAVNENTGTGMNVSCS